MAGKFVVQTSPGRFCGVALEMKLEQTIQRSKKSHNRIIDQTSNEAYILQWKLMYHEALEICNVYSELTEVKCRHIEVELPLHHELHGTINISINEAVGKVVWFSTSEKKMA